MKHSPHPNRSVTILSVCLVGWILLTSGCMPVPSNSGPAATTTNSPAAPAGYNQTLVPAAATMPVEVMVETEIVTRTETPYVWIDLETPVPQTGTLPVFPTFTATSTPTITLTPTKGPTTRFTRTSTNTATVTATLNPPEGSLSIRQPGPLSKITSPYEIVAAITRGEDKLVHLNLIGEGGQTFYSEVLDYRLSEYNRLLISPSLEFTIPTVAENARLILYTYDLQGRIMALTSVDLILLSIGRNEIKPVIHRFVPFIIDTPDDQDEISGKRLLVSGRAAPVNENPVIIELLDDNGEVLVKREMNLDLPLTGETYTHFVIELDYAVSSQVHARLIVRQESDTGIPGTIALSSVAVTLLP